ncbi:MAG: CCA tRNA nucleotidyltransferase [Candidatus Saccharibacteria bacterium]|nr:CCA tRNA nucleotidyltransferase [Candidatus Saccharibacteria bacterium]
MSQLPADVAEVFQKVHDIVGLVYLVGGPVRDVLHGRDPKDLDFTTNLHPDEIEAKIEAAGIKTFSLGKRFGTVGFKLDGHHLEITTFRIEKYDGISRKPVVEYVDDITADLSRRDFTINAMAMRSDGTVIDPFGGQADLAAKTIRAVGKAGERYYEDPLRMLRAGRLAAELGFTIEEETFLSADHHADRILGVSKERWVQELDRLLVAKHADYGLRYLAKTDLLNYMIPELAVQVGYDQDSPYHELDLFEHSIKTVMLSEPEGIVRWAALLHDVGKPFVRHKNRQGYSNYHDHAVVGAEMVLKIGHYLKWSRARTEEVFELVLKHLEENSPIAEADSDARYK